MRFVVEVMTKAAGSGSTDPTPVPQKMAGSTGSVAQDKISNGARSGPEELTMSAINEPINIPEGCRDKLVVHPHMFESQYAMQETEGRQKP